MEEEKKIGEVSDAAAQESEEREMAPKAEAEHEAESTQEPAEESAEQPLAAEEEPTPPIIDWQFCPPTPTDDDAPPLPKQPMGAKGFFIAFGAVLGVCLALLVLVLFVGDEGFQLVRNITNERTVYITNEDGAQQTPAQAADTVAASTVTVCVRTETAAGIGSGFIYTADGYIITNQHVIDGATSVQVILPSGEALDATVKGYDEEGDVAVLKVDATDLTPVTLGSSSAILVGEQVVAVGTPGKIEYAGTATFGRISTTKRLLALYDANGTVTRKLTLIQTDTSVNPGNSGGPLADMNGHVVGMVVMKVSTMFGMTFEGVGFALPIDGVREIADQIIEKGSFTGQNPIAEGRSLLGVTGHTVKGGYWYDNEENPDTGVIGSYTEEQENTHYAERDGIYVTAVNGGNAIGKMAAGDLILAVNGLDVTGIEELIAAVNRHYVGETVTLTVLRNGTEINVNIILYEG